MNKHFSKENIKIANKHISRGLTSLVTNEIQIKTTMNTTYMAIINTQKIISVGKYVEQLEPSYNADRSVK